MLHITSFFDASTGTYNLSSDCEDVKRVLSKRDIEPSAFDALSVHEKIELLLGRRNSNSTYDWNDIIRRYAGEVPEVGVVMEKALEVGHALCSTAPVQHQHGKVLEEYRADGASWKNGHQMKMYPGGQLIVNIWTQWFELTCLDHVIMMSSGEDGTFKFEAYVYNGFGYGLQVGKEEDAYNIMQEYASLGHPVEWMPCPRNDSVTYMPRITENGVPKLIGDDGTVHESASHLSSCS